MVKPNPRPVGRRYESVESAAARLGIDKRTLRRRIQDGSITGYHIGKGGKGRRPTVRVRVDEVDEKLLRPIPTTQQSA
jgi:excisionase family DNA binding protein